MILGKGWLQVSPNLEDKHSMPLLTLHALAKIQVNTRPK